MHALTLIYEGGTGGHRKEFIEYILIFLNENPLLKEKYIIVLNSKLKNELAETIGDMSGIKIHEVDTSEAPDDLLKKSFWEWILLEKIIRSYHSINKIIFMNLDLFQYLIIHPKFKKYNLQVSGILFQPYHHLPVLPLPTFDTLKSNLRIVRKYLTTWLIIKRNKKLHTIFILNDEQGVKKLNNHFLKAGANKFSYLPDPIDTRNLLTNNSSDLVRLKYNISLDKKILLLFGSIDERKNLANILQSLTLLTIEEQSQIAFIIAGRFKAEQSKKLKDLVFAVIAKYPSLQIICKDEFISNTEMEQLFRACDVVLMPYINFYSSSGVIGHAAKYNKKVVASSLSIVADIVKKYNMGLVVNPTNLTEIKNAIVQLSTENCGLNQSEKFVKEHYYLKYSQTLLSI